MYPRSDFNQHKSKVKRDRESKKKKKKREMIRCHWWKTTRSWMKPVELGFDGWLQQECQHHFAGCHSVKSVFIKASSLKREGSVWTLTQLFPFRKAPWCLARYRWSEKLAWGASSFPTKSVQSLLTCRGVGKKLLMNVGKMHGERPTSQI